MYIKKPIFTVLIVAMGLITMIAAIACNSSDPETFDVMVAIKSGVMDP